MTWTTNDIQSWLGNCTARMKTAAPELNTLDGQLGDGDLGATLEKCASLMQGELAGDQETISDVFRVCASACARASGSSFGTLMAVAFLTMAKETVGKCELELTDVDLLIDKVLTALMARGRSALGDKTALDSLEAIRVSSVGLSGKEALPELAISAAKRALDEFRDKKNQIGRARMFGDASIGLDDPGMVAVLRIVGAK